MLDIFRKKDDPANLFKVFFQGYDRIVIFDTETTGLRFERDEIIEFAAVVLERHKGKTAVVQTYDQFISLSPGNTVPPEIERLTGITTEELERSGIPKSRLAEDLKQMFAGQTVLMAYNAHFDLSFLYYFLLRHGDPGILKGKDKVDVLTIYKDRRKYPHRLENAIEAYGLKDKVANTHRAIDDVMATMEVLRQMELERDNLFCYINLFGYNPRYGVSGKPIGSVMYKPQHYYNSTVCPLYETRDALWDGKGDKP